MACQCRHLRVEAEVQHQDRAKALELQAYNRGKILVLFPSCSLGIFLTCPLHIVCNFKNWIGTQDYSS